MPRSYAALIPLRGGSKSIPFKNIKPFCGRPLCSWVLEAALAVPELASVWVSTDSDAIANAACAVSPRVLVHHRPDALSGDLTTTEAVMIDWIHSAGINTDQVVTLQATSPQTTAADVSAAIATLEAQHADSLVTGIRTHRFFWTDNGQPLNYTPALRPLRQQWDGTFMENGAFYVSRKERLLAGESRLHGRIALHVMDSFAGMELDEPEDWHRLEEKFKTRNLV